MNYRFLTTETNSKALYTVFTFDHDEIQGTDSKGDTKNQSYDGCIKFCML